MTIEPLNSKIELTTRDTVNSLWISAEEAYKLMEPQTPLADVLARAESVTREYHGRRIGLCSIYPLRVGRCGSDCAFCAQSAHHTCAIDTIAVENVDVAYLVSCAQDAEEQGVGWFSLVTSGEKLTDREFQMLLKLIHFIRRSTSIKLCASIGELDRERAEALKAAGIFRYHHNIETAPAYFPQICSSHAFEDKLATIRFAKQAGMEICCGGIISLGETARDRVDMALAIRELDATSVPLNILNPIPGTRLEHQSILSPEDILRTFAVFRILLPIQTIRFAGGRESALGKREYEGYQAGVNGLIAGNFLTTSGKSIAQELEALACLGLEIDKAL